MVIVKTIHDTILIIYIYFYTKNVYGFLFVSFEAVKMATAQLIKQVGLFRSSFHEMKERVFRN